MQILLWLVPPVVVTVIAMLWVGWVGRDRPTGDDRSEAAQERARQRFAEAILREHPGRARPEPGGNLTRVPTPRERSTGVAVRTQRPR